MRNLLLSSALLLFLGSCHVSENENNMGSHLNCLEFSLYYDTFSDYLFTVMPDSAGDLNLIKCDSNRELDHLDTLDLIFMNYACDCPDWIPVSDKKNGQQRDSKSNSPHISYYIEPAKQTVKLNSSYKIQGNIVRFIGREYTNEGLPADSSFMDPHPPRDRIFRYYAYHVLRPFKAWIPYSDYTTQIHTFILSDPKKIKVW